MHGGSRTGRARASSRTSRRTSSEPNVLAELIIAGFEPGRDPAAHLTRAPRAPRGGDARTGSRSSSACPPGFTATSRTPPRRAPSSRSSAARAARPGRTCRRLLRARALVPWTKAAKSASSSGELAKGPGRRRVRPAPQISGKISRGAVRGRPIRDPRSGRRPRPPVDPVPAIARPLARLAGLSGSTSMPLTRGQPRSARTLRLLLRGVGAGRLDRRQPAQVARRVDGLLHASGHVCGDVFRSRLLPPYRPRVHVPGRVAEEVASPSSEFTQVGSAAVSAPRDEPGASPLRPVLRPQRAGRMPDRRARAARSAVRGVGGALDSAWEVWVLRGRSSCGLLPGTRARTSRPRGAAASA